MISFLRLIKFALQDIFRNFSLSFMTVLILVLMLLSINTLAIIQVLTDEATTSVKNKVDVTVYFDHEATDEDISEIKGYVQSFPEVTSIKYLTREEVLEEFRSHHQDNAEIIESLDELEENPLGPTMVIKTRQPSDYQKIINSLNVPEYETLIEAKTFGDTEIAIDRINVITRQVERFSIILTGLFTIIAFFIIFNTIRVSIYTQRVEISIKKLVGATNWFVRGPYIIEAFIFSIISTAGAYGLVYIASGAMDPYIEVVFGRADILTNYFVSNIIMLVGIQFVTVLLLTIFSSLLAMRRHLQV